MGRWRRCAGRLALWVGNALSCALPLLCATAAAHAAVAIDEGAYTTLYPYYAEFCALSEISKKPGFGTRIIAGGPGGHVILYLNGVCRDKDAHYPTIKLCDAGTAAPDRGVGLSVNAHFKNANWVATQGRDFLFHGGLAPGERLTRQAYWQTLRQAEAAGILDGVQYHASVFDDQPAGMSRHDFMYDVSIGTDFAIGFARDRYCGRVPLRQDQMARVVRYLNGVNDLYKDGTRTFEWNVLENNCAHLTHNALAAAGVWDEWPTGRPAFISIFSFPVPKNEFVNLMRRTNDLPLDNLDSLYADATARRTLMQEHWLPTEPGALAESEKVIQQNDVYNTKLRLIFYDDPLFAIYQNRFDAIFSTPRYLDIRANLAYFAALYRRIEATRKPVQWYLDAWRPGPNGDPNGTVSPEKRRDFPAFYAEFYRVIDQESVELGAQIASLGTAR